MRVFIDPLAQTRQHELWLHPTGCHLLSPSVGELMRFARTIGLLDQWMQWSRCHVPFYRLSPIGRNKARLAGAIEIPRSDARIIARLWSQHMSATLWRLCHRAGLPEPTAQHLPPAEIQMFLKRTRSPAYAHSPS